MSFCPSGISGPKAGVADLVAYNGTVLAGFIEAALGPGAIPLAALVGVLSWDTPTFCASDPPAIPTFTAGDVASLFTESITGVSVDPTADARFEQLLEHFAWYQLCECKTSSTPASSSFTWPGGATINPTSTSPSANPCGSVKYGLNFNNFDFQSVVSGNTWDIGDLASRMFPNMPTKSVTSSAWSHTVTAIDIGATPPTQLTLQFGPITSADSNSASSHIVIKGYTSSLTEITGNIAEILFSGNNIAGHTTPQTVAVPSTTRYITILSSVTDGFNTRTAEIDVDFLCSGSTTFNSPCCPPDPVAQQLLQRILTLTTLIQRQVAPFAYVPGTLHSGLSGSGELTVNGLLGLKVSPTTIPSHFGSETGDPDSLWLDSWIRWGNADGWSQREFLTAAPFVSLPNLAGQYTKIGYTLAPGIVADFLELAREP